MRTGSALEGGMDEEMEDTVQYLDLQIDPDYEFDASQYFDFSRKESLEETQQAERWFETATSNAPSPFIAKLTLTEDILLENMDSPKYKIVGNTYSVCSGSDIGTDSEFSASNEDDRGIDRESLFSLPNEKLHNAQDEEGLTTGVTLYDHMAQESTKAKTKPASKAAVPRSSTLMKPTASHLAKQNQPREVGGNRFLQRSWKSRVKHNEKISETGIESQAAKRQKLEAGCLRKVSEIKQQVNLMHKVSKKVTIPREPELKTAHRAQRIRPKSNIVSGESVKPMGHTFKARPLNKKILEAPSLLRPQKSTPRLPEFQEFHLKTSERAAASSLPKNKSVKVVYKPSTCSIMHNDTVNSNRPMGFTDKENELKPKFKARPFNKKIFSSKGDIGVFRNTKKEPTVPMEFKFSTANRLQHHPPIELFSKLSLASELQQNTVPQQKFPQNTSIPTKGLKENIVGPSQTEHGVSHTSKEKLQQLVGKQQIQCGTGGRISETGHRANTSRSLSIR